MDKKGEIMGGGIKIGEIVEETEKEIIAPVITVGNKDGIKIGGTVKGTKTGIANGEMTEGTEDGIIASGTMEGTGTEIVFTETESLKEAEISAGNED